MRFQRRKVRSSHPDATPPSVHFRTDVEVMATEIISLGLPIPERALKDLSRNILGVIPKFSEQDRDSGVK